MTAPAPVGTLDPDTRRSFALGNLADHISGPLAAGAVLEPVPLDAAGAASVTWERDPLLLVQLDTDLGRDELVVSATIGPAAGQGAAQPSTVTLTFAAFSERGAVLPLWPFGSVAPGLDDASVSLTAERRLDDVVTRLPADQLRTLLRLQLAQGTAARVAFVLAAHKASVRRAAREIAACRTVATARSGSLDRHGRDLGVARFTDRLVGTVTPVPLISTAPRLEPDGREADADYRRRLAALRAFAVPTRAGVTQAINGPGADADPPAGWLAALGGTRRVQVIEQTNPFAVAVLLVAAGDADQRAGFLAELRRDRLVRAVASPAVAQDEAQRLLTPEQRAELDRLRTVLGAGYDFQEAAADDPAFAEGLARALALVAQVRAALGDSSTWRLTRAQDSGGGSRYELGLGCELVLPEPAQAETLRTAAIQRPPPASVTADVAGALAAAASAAAAGPDPMLGWLLSSCGLRTAVPGSDGRAFASTMPMSTLEVSGPATVAAPGWTQVVGVRSAPGVVIRYDRSQPVLQAADLSSAEVTVVGVATDVASMDDVVHVGTRGATGGLGGLLVGYDRAAGTLRMLRPIAGTFVPVSTSEGWGSRWTHLAAGDFGGTTALRDLLLYDARSGAYAVYGVLADGSVVSSVGSAVAGVESTAAALPHLGSWSHLVVVAGPSGQPDRLLSYDRQRGDVQLAEPAPGGTLRPLWVQAGWRPGFSHLVGLTAPAGAPAPGDPPAPALLGYDRERGDVATYLDVESGALTPLGADRLPPRAVTQLASLNSTGAQTAAVAAYDRASGNATVWDVPLVRTAAGAPGPTGATVPAKLWGSSTSAVLSASYPAVGGPDGGTHAALADGLARAAAAWAARGSPAWDVVLDADAQEEAFARAADPGPVGQVLAAVGLPTATAGFDQEMASAPADQTATLVMPAAVADLWRAGDGTRQAQAFVDVLATSGLAAAIGLVVDSGEVMVVVSVTALPGTGLNLSGRAAAGYRWYCLPVRGLPGVVTALGPATVFRPADEGLSAVVVLGYARSGRADPYEVLLDVPDDAALTPEQYEFLLNVVERAVPAGIQVSTLGLRRRHLDLDGDGVADPLPPVSTHVYRRFRHPASTHSPQPPGG
jgi:hypothetical protein